MAKGKSAAALFEVIRGPRGSAAGVEVRNAASLPPMRLAQSEPSSYAFASLDDPTSHAKASSTGGRKLQFEVGRGAAIVTAAALVATLGAAYLAGKHATADSGPLIAATSKEELLANPPTPGVMDVPHANNSGTPEDSAAEEAPAIIPGGRAALAGARLAPATPAPSAAVASGSSSASGTWNDPQQPKPVVVAEGHRQIGLNYVIVQTYPDAKTAGEAAELLRRNHIAATVEGDLPGFMKNGWFAVVGTMGFSRVHNNPDLDRYVAAIDHVSDQFAGKSSFKRFDPHPYRWRTPEGS